MSLDKAIKHGKEKRKQYTGARAVDPSAEIMAVAIGAKRTDYTLLKCSRKLLMQNLMNMRKETVDEKVVLCLYAVTDGHIWHDGMCTYGQ